MKKLGFVIINYNDYESTKILLDNIKDYKAINKIVIVDNNSTDNSFNKLKKLEDKNIEIIKNNNRSYASGLNKGAKYLINDYKELNIIFSNSDIIIKDEETLKKLNSNLKENIGVLAPTINTHGVISKGWPIPTVGKEILFNIPLISRYYRNKYLNYEEGYYKDNIMKVDVVSGCFFLVNSKALEEINFFDENTKLYYEENILSKKLEKTKYYEAVELDTEIIHNHSVTIDKNITNINKYKILKESQRYYVINYLKYNKFNLFLLDFTNKLSLIILYIRKLFK